MERTEHKITLDVHKAASSTSVSLKRGDTAHRLLITLSEGGYPYHIGEDCTAVFSAVKPDGKTIFNDCTIEGDVVIYDLTEQTTAAFGEVYCEIQIYGADGALLTSASFLLLVEEGAGNRGAVVSSDEFGQLRDMFDTARVVSSTASRAAERANRAAGACMVIGSASGDMIHLDDAIDANFLGLRIFGKTTQNGTPTPDGPEALSTIGSSGNIKLTSAGKNILPYPYYQTTLTLNGMTFTDNKDGSLTVSGVSTSASSFWFTGYTIRLKKGAKYSLSAYGHYTVVGTPYLWLASSKKGAITMINLSEQKSSTFTANDDYTDAAVYITASKAGYSIEGTITPQLTVGDATVDYVPYIGKRITIPVVGGLRGIPIASGGNYTDVNGKQWICDEIDLTKGVYIKRVHARVINGSASLLVSEREGYNRFEARFTDDLLAKHESQALCTHFRVSSRLLSKNDINNAICGYAGTARIFMRFDDCATVDELSAWLAENPVTYIYTLATPIETKLSDDILNAYLDSIVSRSGDTVVSSDVGAHMALEYLMDARKYIDKMISTGIHEATLE